MPVPLTSAAPLTAAMRQVLSGIQRAQRPPLHSLSPQQARSFYDRGAQVLDVSPRQLPRVESLSLPARDGHGLAVRLYAPSSERLPVLLYLHGGGYVVGSLASHDALCREIAALADCAVLALDYRLAPEAKFPTAVNDAWDALSAVAAGALEGWGLDASRLAVAGDSAGGTLAAVCAIQARDAGLTLALQALIYPGCGGHQDSPSHRTYAQGHLLQAADLDWFFQHYLRSPAERNDWRFAPLYAAELEGVAPVWLALAECDMLLDEALQYADRLRMARVAVDLEIYRGMTHEFIKMGRVLPQARRAQADLACALKQAWTAGAAS
jgi:acetyl esterase